MIWAQLLVFFVLVAAAQSPSAPAAQHPLDSLTSNEIWTVYDVLQSAGHAPSGTMFASVLLRPPAKAAVLAWQPGQPFGREADVVLLRGNATFAARVDLVGKRVAVIEELKGQQAPFVTSELMSSGEIAKSDPRIVQALQKRGIADLRTVECVALPVAYRAIPEQATRRIGFGYCSLARGTQHSWGRSIEGLTFQLDMVEKKIIKVTETDVAPVPTGDINFEELPENPRAGATPIVTSQPRGAGYRYVKGEVAWQNWRFRVRIDPRVGVVLNLVRVMDGAKTRPVLYEASVSELFVPYMDTANGWNNRAFIDAGQFFATSPHLKPMRAGIDCPADATWIDGISSTENGAPRVQSQMACLFERAVEGPAWRHSQSGEVHGRPNRQLVLRSAAVIGNYDYIMDWRFEPDGTIEVGVGATGIIETKATAQKKAPEHGHGAAEEMGQHVAENTIGVNHDHFFSYRLDFDVDGVNNSFMLHRMVPKKVENDPMRKWIWVAKPAIAQREKDAILDIRLEQPSMWMFVNPAVKGPLNHHTAYEVMPGATAKSLMPAEDPTQQIGAFSEHQFWVTPYRENERYASGTYVTSSDAKDGLAFWTQANRPIENTDIVGWYTLGFHHIPRSEDWPVMPVMWHHFHIRPFHFFQANPVLDLPKSVTK